ncbi:MAG TPA: hypothetical protein PLI09_18480 [Candidatus Hydrogenedentes bacterium]|nr:hypothetical protein [Candidatus Hydrogenedentota bacterium]
MPENKKKKSKANTLKTADNAAALGSALVGGQATVLQAAATDAMVDGMDKFRDMVERVGNKDIRFRAGHLFETILAAKENASLAGTGSKVRVIVTHLDHRNTVPQDLEWQEGGRILAEGQAKFTAALGENGLRRLAEAVNDTKYDGMRLYVPADRIERVREKLLEMAKNSTDTDMSRKLEATAKRLVDHDTGIREVLYADKMPEIYALGNEVSYVFREAATAGAWAAASGAIVGGGISLAKNAYCLAKGDLSKEEAAKSIIADAGKAGARSGASGIIGASIRYGAQKAGLNALAKSNVATAVAAGVIDCGVTIWKFAEGELTAEETMEKLGQNGTSTISSIYVGAAAGAIFGPVGAVVGSIAGYLVASNLYQGCLAILKNARLAEEQANRIVAICEESIRQMRSQREEFESLLEKNIKIRRQEFACCFAAIDGALESDSHENAISAVADFLGLFGKKLKFPSFEEFDAFMTNLNEPLRLD